jgi:VanZ family protein
MITQSWGLNAESFSVISLRRNHFLALAALYALAMVYASLVLGPGGFHYMPIGLGDAWDKLLSVRFVPHGSNERPDWIANMLMPVPLAFLINSMFGRGIATGRRATGIVVTLAVTFLFIVAIKYAQLFFPPRTVTLNYIAAQAIGAVLGVIAFQLSHTRLYPRLLSLFENGEGLIVVLGFYTAFITAYYLMPFDITLSVGDLAARALELFDILPSVPGEGHDATYKLLLVVEDTLTAVPLGMYLAVVGRRRTTPRLVWRAVGLIFLIFVAQLFVLGSEPFLVSLIYRTTGAVIGVLFIRKIKGKDLRKRHYYFSRFLPVVIPFYLLLVMFVSGVLGDQWWSLAEATNALEPRQFLPFWNFYIVSKAHAMQSLVVTSMIYAPIGVMVWLRRGFWSSGGTFSASLAFGLSLLMELARMMKPGMRPDFSDPIIAGIAAGLAFKAMPFLWRMFEREAARSGTLDFYIAGMLQHAAAEHQATGEPLTST